MKPCGSTRRLYRYVRSRARAQWYLGPKFHLPLIVYFPLMVWMLGAWSSLWAWGVCMGLMLWSGYVWWCEARAEKAFWGARCGETVWFQDGCLWVSSHGRVATPPEDLSDVRAIDAFVDRHGSVERLRVQRKDAGEFLCLGFDDMNAFTQEFRRHADQARFRRVRLTWRMGLREV